MKSKLSDIDNVDSESYVDKHMLKLEKEKNLAKTKANPVKTKSFQNGLAKLLDKQKKRGYKFSK